METNKMQNKISVDDSFKSYYVVWKLPCFVFPSNPMISFKSYYVVWKLLPAFKMKNTGRV